jgi:hypothetical protein
MTTSNFCSKCGEAVSPGANFCNQCGHQLTPLSSAPRLDKQHLAYLIGGMTALCLFAFFYSTLADMEEGGGHMRMHAIGWLIYGLGGKFLLSLVVGGIAGAFAWAIVNWKLGKK